MKITAVMLRPDYLTDDYGKDVYVAYVEAETVKDCVKVAQDSVFYADKADKLEPQSPDDYALCVAFKGHIDVAAFGWQTTL